MNKKDTYKAKLLLVDDEPNVLKSLSRLLRGHDITALTSPEEALSLADHVDFDVIISDLRMPSMDGVTFLTKVLQIQPDSTRIMLTGFADLDSAQAAINQARVYRFINKPWTDIEVVSAVKSGVERKRLLHENRLLANQVREQQKLLNDRDAILRALEKEEPGITKVVRMKDGSIMINEEDYDT